ncbi:MAG: EF-P lysine aminoacylase EpmA [Planctomycetaceae bacterium]|nr:EF-P lysine aminoacylase EpmA [Planctomycetaceae bacterium]
MPDSRFPMPDYLPTASLPNLAAMSGLLRKLRGYFEERGFLEVITPLLSADTVVNRYLEPIPVSVERIPNRYQTCYLQTSPEFCMKRLLVAGAEAIFQITHAFRGGDFGQRHNVEFTMLEWYRIRDDYGAGIAFLAGLTEELFQRGGVEKNSYYEKFFHFTGMNPHTVSCEVMRQFADDNRIPYPESYGVVPKNRNVSDDFLREPWVDLLFAEVVQPNLGVNEPVILYDFPIWQSQLATTRTVKQREETYDVSERFELYVDGIELANGYAELCDQEAFRQRIQETNRNRAADGHAPLPEQSRLLQAMEAGLPPCCGVALGVERLLMTLLNADEIDEVLPFPFDRA